MKTLLLLVLLFSTSAFASDNYCATWGCVSTIKDFYTNTNGQVYINTPVDQSPVNCTQYPGGYFVLDPNFNNFDQIYSTLLAAYFSDSKIQLRVVEGSSNCLLAYVRLSKDF